MFAKRNKGDILESEIYNSKKSVKIGSRNIQSKKDTQYNGQNKKDKTENNGLQNITQKTKYRAAPTTPETGGDLRCSSRVSSSCSTRGTRRVDCMQ